MPGKYPVRWLIGIAAVLFLGSVLYTLFSGSVSARQAAPIDSSTLTRTTVAATLYAPIVPGKNVVYAAAFELAWGELCDSLAQGPVQIENEPPPIAAELNQRLVGKNILPASAYFVAAGTDSQGIVEKINDTLAKKFNSPFPPVSYTFKHPDWEVLIYAFMQRDLPFAVPFKKTGLQFQQGGIEDRVNVKGFGVTDSQREMLKQVTEYRTKGGYRERIISIETLEKDDEMILAMIGPQSTLLETIENVDELIQASIAADTATTYNGDMKIPEIDVNVLHAFAELIGKEFPGKAPEGYVITAADECIRFRLDNEGARLDVSVRLAAMRKAGLPLAFDRPFLLWLRTKGQALPYFAIWVDNTEVLVRG